MLCNNKVSVASGKALDFLPVINMVICEITSKISGFRQWLVSSGLSLSINENLLNDKLTRYLNVVCNNQYNTWIISYNNQSSQNYQSRRTPDIGVQLCNVQRSYPNFLYIEGKRLPHDLSRRTQQDREYVQGNCGGIERFKREEYAKDLNSSIMVGYIQKKTTKEWPDTINDWINDLANKTTLPTRSKIEATQIINNWSVCDKLMKISDFHYFSVNSRISLSEDIRLDHFFIDLS